jgi:hypothetical protein
MRIKSVFVHIKDEGKPTECLNARATILVPGLGEVATENALSKELTERIAAECLAALRLKLGQKV